MALGILEAAQEIGKIKPLLEMEHNSVEYLHSLIEALRYVDQHQVQHIISIGFAHLAWPSRIHNIM